ncbi:aminoglycoside phosphotransferase family protein [Catellatospora sp. NPDC049111]|uniref:phosphotransferase enzyme family protein n=1 Tax=Catellatospora sp. NPDC049111 TaxID=3155271 RepID=UPI0033F33C59
MSGGRFTKEIMTAAMRHLADAHDLDANGARLLRLTNNAVFALPACAVVIRIARSHLPGDRISKGVKLARWFEAIDAPTIRLAGPEAQPLHIDGFQATIWRYLPPGAPLTAMDLGTALRQFHSLGQPPFPIPVWDPVGDARRRLADSEDLDDADRNRIYAWCTQLEPRVSELRQHFSTTLVHGDAHVGNLLRDGGRAVFCDFDPICRGPWQADLAAVAVGEDRFGRRGGYRTLADSYGCDVRADPRWPVFRAARELKMIVAAVPLMASSPGVAREFRVRLDSVMSGDRAARWTPFAELPT